MTLLRCGWSFFESETNHDLRACQLTMRMPEEILGVEEPEATGVEIPSEQVAAVEKASPTPADPAASADRNRVVGGVYEIHEDTDRLTLTASDRELLTVLVGPEHFRMLFPAGFPDPGASSRSGDFEVDIFADFQLTDWTGVTQVRTEEVSELGSLLPRVFGKEFLGLVAHNSGELDIELRDCRIHVPVDSQFENWSVRFSSGEWWFGLPGGGFDLVGPERS